VTDFIFKTEPSDYSFADLVKAGSNTWDGVRNPAALRTMKEMAKGDRVFVYHTGAEKAVVGTATAASTAYPDPKQSSLSVIDLKAGRALPQAVTLAQMKADAAFADSPLVRMGRLSIVRLNERQAKVIEKFGGL
jgi:predicted RNA-binding protein with PUA-like domain